MDGISALIGDLAALEYISSAGLRLLSAAQKEMNKQGEMTLYIKEEYLGKVTEGMLIRVKEKEYIVTSVETMPKTIPEGFDEYMLHLSGMHVGEWVFGVTALQTDLADGVYKAEIVIESIAPIALIFD